MKKQIKNMEDQKVKMELHLKELRVGKTKVVHGKDSTKTSSCFE